MPAEITGPIPGMDIKHRHPRISESSLRRTDANHTVRWQSKDSDKQPAGLKLTSVSGEQTYYEATIAGSTEGNRTIT